MWCFMRVDANISKLAGFSKPAWETAGDAGDRLVVSIDEGVIILPAFGSDKHFITLVESIWSVFCFDREAGWVRTFSW